MAVVHLPSVDLMKIAEISLRNTPGSKNTLVSRGYYFLRCFSLHLCSWGYPTVKTELELSPLNYFSVFKIF